MRVGKVVAMGVALALMGAACSNSKSQSENTAPATTGDKTSQTTASAADLKVNKPRPGVKGVDDKTIRVAVITSKTNPVGGKYVQLADGIKAYFKRINDAGGIYGRKLEVVKERDDQIGLQNAQQVTASLADDNAFATFLATLQFTGADTLAKANMPTFIWNINPEMASTPTVPHLQTFATVPAICFTCLGPLGSWLAVQNNFTKAGVLAYGVSPQSKTCAKGTRDGLEKNTNGKTKVVYFNDTIPFSGDISADVARMKDKGVQFVFTCMDTNQVVKLQKEMKKQGLNAVQDLPNAYDHDFLKANGELFEGSFLQPYFYPPWESTPQSEQTKQYLSDIKAITDDPVEVTQVGYLLAQMLVDGLKGSGPEFTQQSVVDWLNSQTAYDDHGSIAPIDWTKGHIDPQSNPEVRAKTYCQPILQITGGKFVPYKAESGKPWTCFDQTKDGTQTPEMKSFAPDGVG